MNVNGSSVIIAASDTKRKLDEVELQNQLEDVIKLGCRCTKNCLMNLCEGPNNYSRGIAILKQYRAEVACLSAEEKKDFIKCKILSLPKQQCKNGRSFYTYFVSYSNVVYAVCRIAYLICYGITSYGLKHAKRTILDDVHSTTGSFNDHTHVNDLTIKQLSNALGKTPSANELERRDAVGLCKLSGSDASLKMHAWMSYYFDTVGDNIPNSNGEIHLEPQDKEQIYSDYVGDCEDTPMSLTSFHRMWDHCFKHVKIRVYKQVTGKCMHCFKLSELRRKRKDRVGRGLATLLHAFHKVTYMKEKTAYYARALEAKNDPFNFVSLISDGMAQNHTKLPWLANLKEFSVDVTQHLQGIIDHGVEFVVYRTYNNVSVDSNLAIHCMLLQLEQKLRNGVLPSTVYLQVDGGSENTNKYTLAVCELLIIRRLCNKVVLTRLPVGHTHENIDAKFALIWVEARNETILTPLKYLEVIVNACSRRGHSVRVIDIFVVPNYKEYFEGYTDEHFAHYSKNEDTQLQFIFDAVPVSNEFPYGVKLTYRAYSSDFVYEIKESKSNSTGFEPVKVKVTTFPQEGTWLLRGVPNRVLKPAPFVRGSRAHIVSFVAKFKKEFEESEPAAVREWEQFMDTCPLTDDSTQYASTMHVPFKDILFSGDASVSYRRDAHFVVQADNVSSTFAGLPIREFETTPSVAHHNRGRPIPPRPNPRIEINPQSGEPLTTSDILDVNRMTVSQLKEALISRGLPVNGKKQVLKDRLLADHSIHANVN